jgi:hypothetical protein
MMHAPILSTAQLEDFSIILARENFAVFRQMIRPKMIRGWWTYEVSVELQQFYDDFAAGKRPWLAIEAPPQTGKSWAATDFIAYVAGRNPDWKTIFGSYSDDLGVRTNLDLQRIMATDKFRDLFPDTIIGEHGLSGDIDLGQG